MNRSWNFRRGVLLALAGYTAFLVFAAPQRCADALQAGLRLCGGPLLVSLFPFLIVSALAAGCGAGQWLGFVFRPAARLMGIRAKGAGGVLLIGALGGFAPAAVAASEAVRTGQLTSRQASALLPACVCSGPSFVILTVGQQMLGSRAVGVRLFAAQLLAGYLTAALLCRMQGGAGQAPPAQGETIPLPALDAVIAQAAVTYLKLCGFVLYFRLLAPDPSTDPEPTPTPTPTPTPEPNYNPSTGNAVVDRAYSWVGKAEYVWGACSPGAFDCSGFVSYCLTGAYSRLGTTYTFLGWTQVSDPQPGDVAVNAEHCGIYIGGGQMIHAADYGIGVIQGPVQSGMIYVRY